jgi:hypothetical protein
MNVDFRVKNPTTSTSEKPTKVVAADMSVAAQTVIAMSESRHLPFGSETVTGLSP